MIPLPVVKIDYPLSVVPAWCRMPIECHQDGVGGCWGIYHGEVAKHGEAHCQTCEYKAASSNSRK